MPADIQNPSKNRPFVATTLGPWSSHPDMMARQKRRLLWLGATPFLLGVLVVALVLTNYRAADFANVRDWAGFLAACGGFWKKIKISLAVLALAGCASAGFALTLNLLWMVGMTLGRNRAGIIAERDRVPFPAWMVVCFSLFWLVPPALWACRGAFTALDWRLNLVVQLSANLLCLFPVAALLAWTRWAGRKAGPGEELRHPVGHLLWALLLLALAGWVWAAPRPEFFDEMMEEWFGWVAQCGVDIARVYDWARMGAAAILALWGAFHLLLWRLKVEIRPKKGTGRRQGRGEDGDDGEDDASGDAIPAGAQYLLAHLPPGVTAEKGPEGKTVYRRPVGETSPEAKAVKHGLDYLMGGGMRPTKDQEAFFERYVEAFGRARREFGHDHAGQDDKTSRPDLLLVGQDGSGRTEILLAAALYAAVVRGQRVLFLCAEREACRRLAERATGRLEWMGVDAYVTAAELDTLDVAAWLDSESGCLPANLLFATPDMAEKSFFLNPSTRQSAKAEAMRRLVVGFGAVFVDDFLDMPLAFRAHTAFLLDKFKLLQAAEPALAQYAVATGPLRKPDGAEALGSRLFGEAGFDPEHNVWTLKPRECGPYWFGSLRVAARDGEGGLSLEAAMEELARASVAGGFSTLLYQKGMSRQRKETLKSDLTADATGGDLEVASHFRELADLEAVPDNVFYLSLAGGDAGMALRLNLEGGDAVFFRIVQDGAVEEAAPEEFGLLPDETALPLRIHHLRNVLQFVRSHVPVPATAWECFKISLTHPCVRELVPGANPGAISVEWLHDEIKDEVYGPGTLWPYLALENTAAFGVAGSGDFNSLPTDRGEIWKSAAGGGRLLLAVPEGDGDGARPGHLAVWRDQRNGTEIGESDLAHADVLAYAGQDEYTVAEAMRPGKEDAGRYAIQFLGQYRHGGDTEFIFPIRHLEWRVPRGELRVPSVSVLAEMAHFRVERTSSPTCRVDGKLCGLLNWRGEPKMNQTLPYGHEAYLSCLVLLPTLDPGGDAMAPESAEELVQNCLDGAWRTEAGDGYSCALTHALAAALRGKMADWPFYAVAPAFWTEGREDSVGGVTIWIVEPVNSGRTAQPVLKRLMEADSDFRRGIYRDARATLEECQSLEELRMASRLAFAGEALSEDDRQKAIGVLDTLLDRERASDWMARHLQERREARQKRRAEGQRPRTAVPDPQEREFDAAVVEALKRFEDPIDVSKFAVEYGWDADKLVELFHDVQWNHPEIFWVSKSWRYQWWQKDDGSATKFIFRDLDYAFGPDKLSRKQKEFDKAVAEALASAEGASDDAEKALRLHDHIVRICDYDTAAAKRNDTSPLARTAYSALVRRSAVCEGYTMAYRLLLQRVGIQSEEVLSDAMRHCWNYVRLGDSWFHADVTWDDPVFSGPRSPSGAVSRRNFLMSDARARETEHHDWNVRGLPAATDTAYDGKNWNAPESGKRGRRAT